MTKPRTYFDQIPIEDVKKIVDPDAPKKDNRGKGDVILEPSSSKTEPYTNWPGSSGARR